ncbi:hypothetical protein [Actinoplanes sp. M2I2]|uniref:hypothetical protein n=1 Tax=Actinoplanes sp. M2I2 TaxID=1734444 RepID=UPI0020225221|nr:hypothetical protein [Actinoplanes sp. M2I2]
MAQDLKTRAERQLALNETAAGDAVDELIAARMELDRRVADPSAITPEQWATGVGARQHGELARAAVAAELAVQAGVRQKLAQVNSPADTATYQALLRASLIALARLRVLLRQGREREQIAAARVRVLNALVDTATARVGASRAGVVQATADQAAVTAARDALTEPPLKTLVADATAARSGATFTAARDRLSEVLPDALRERAHQRYAESAKLADDALEHHGVALAGEDRLGAEVSPASAAVAAERDFRVALAELSGYAAAAAAELAATTSMLQAVAAFPDLSPEQAKALDPADRADAVAAATAEQTLADAVAEVAILQQAVDDARLSARLDDPDSDPETNADVIAAQEALNDAAVQDALTTARAGYDQDARDALDAWEVEVPPELWDALTRFEAAAATLDRLASAPARDALTTGLDTAQDRWADALDEADVQLRRLVVARFEAAARGARAHALAELSADRTAQYARGDGPAGRTADQL